MRLRRLPIDVEERRVRARRSILENVTPPWILALIDRHVIGHDVQELSHVVAPEHLAKMLVTARAAQLFVDARMIDHVIAVATVRCGLQVRRAVESSDAQFREVRNRLRCRREIEFLVYLHPVGGFTHATQLVIGESQARV